MAQETKGATRNPRRPRFLKFLSLGEVGFQEPEVFI